MKILNVFIGAVNALCLVVLLLMLSVQIPSLGMWFYEYEFRKNGTYEVLSMEESELRYVAERVIDYLGGKNPSLSDVRVVVNGRERLFFSENEASHMDDVRVLFAYGLSIRNAAAAGFGITLLYFIIIRIVKKRGLVKLLRLWRGFAVGTVGALAVLSVFIVANFSRAFTIFHEILFKQGNWTFDPRVSLMINMLPNAFFQDIAICIAALFALSLVILAVLPLIFRSGSKIISQGQTTHNGQNE